MGEKVIGPFLAECPVTTDIYLNKTQHLVAPQLNDFQPMVIFQQNDTQPHWGLLV